MNSIYSNNQEVLDFITKAQNKIADLATLLVERGGDITPLDILALELIDFIEVLDNPLTTYTLDEVLRWIEEYSYRANLGEIAYLNIYGYNTTLIQNIVGASEIVSSSITDFEPEVTRIVKKVNHNILPGLQGGNRLERYHLTKEMYDYLANLINPQESATVSLDLSTTGVSYPGNFYELGVSIPAVNLLGHINYGSQTTANYIEYLKNSQLLGTRNSSPTINLQPNPISDTTGIKVDTTYSFNASFNDGLKTSTKTVSFRQPMYYGVINLADYTNANLLVQGTKLVRDRGEMTLSFTLPAGNTLIDENYLVPYLFIPNSWGMITSAFNGMFDFRPDFHDFGRDMPLADGSVADGRIIIDTTRLEGVVTFKFNW